jgi:hypothetical protein
MAAQPSKVVRIVAREVGDAPANVASEIEDALLSALPPSARRFVLGFGALLAGDRRWLAEAVIYRSAIRSAQLRVRVVQLGHPPIRARRPIRVGVVLRRQRSEGGADHDLAGVGSYLQNLVGVSSWSGAQLLCHISPGLGIAGSAP